MSPDRGTSNGRVWRASTVRSNAGERPSGAIRIGISGWRYEPWRGVFYPPGLPQREELAYAARRFATIEINGSFYSLQRPEHYARWHAETPPGFVFSVKGPRFVTHMLKLRGVEAALANFFASGVANLREKLGPFLWQLPPMLGYDADRLERFLALLPRTTDEAAALARRRNEKVRGRARIAYGECRPLRHALEVRHASFVDPGFVALLHRQRVALVVADTAGRWPYAEDLTADFVYVRLHGDRRIYESGYTRAALARWASRVACWSEGRQVDDCRVIDPVSPGPDGEDGEAGHVADAGVDLAAGDTVAKGDPAAKADPAAATPRDVYVYFDNDVKVKAPRDAAALARLVRRTGLVSGDQRPSRNGARTRR